MLRPKLNRIWASTNAILRRDPGDAKYIQGWVSEIPTYQVLNFLQYKIDTTLLALAERGVFEWGGDVQYQLGSIAWDSGTVYISTVGNPDKNKSPKDNPSQWSASSIQIPRASFDSLVSAVNRHIEDLNNPHRVTAEIINAYTKDEINNIVAQYNALVKAHVDNKSNPHGVTATDIGAVPTTGGTYTGTVVFSATYTYFNADKKKFIWSNAGSLKLMCDNTAIGLSGDNKIPTAGKLGDESPMVLDGTFNSVKLSNEPAYAVPQPTYQNYLTWTVCPNVGQSTMYSNTKMEYTPEDGALFHANPVNAPAHHFLTSSQLVDSSNGVTICLDVYLGDDRPADGAPSLLFGLRESTGMGGGNYFYIRGDGTLVAEEYNPTLNKWWSVVASKTPKKGWVRFVAVFNKTSISLYVDGALRNSRDYTNDPIVFNTPGCPSINWYTKTEASIVRNFRTRNMRIWSTALTPEQVSSL